MILFKFISFFFKLNILHCEKKNSLIVLIFEMIDMISSGEENSSFPFLSPKLKMRPALGTSGILNRNQKVQNELKLDQLAPKLKTYVFNPDKSFPNELLREANELSDRLENEISHSKQDLSQQEEITLHRNNNFSSNLVRYHQSHRHRSEMHRGGKITISSDKVIII